ncbi:hypothetical protein FJ955_02975 [Mesorhizobium sp. B2-2-2]|uniref:DUF6074 family protein n=1 Tax=Mesorhizobium sp. B2-2-2 TaxID=2589964 RepID=UPI001128D378|nr:DUF6074 family protein [Mesorhizobium sp. B2-2-2]TPM33719.1 hypothetical protein FJ955_02975 [Mesorhizobium sp. B2-2-2]
MAHNRLPLVEWPPVECQIVPFPTKNRLGKIRRTAEILGGRHGKGADQYWQQVIGGMRSQMEKAGLPTSVIETELQGFADAVLARLSSAQPYDGDAA